MRHHVTAETTKRVLHTLVHLFIHPQVYLFDAHCFCHGYVQLKHLVLDRVKPSFVIFDIRAL